MSAPLLSSGRRCRHRLLDRRRGRRRRAEEEYRRQRDYFTITNKTTSISSSSSHNEGVTSKSAITKHGGRIGELTTPTDIGSARNRTNASLRY